jgi:hypothetical protein
MRKTIVVVATAMLAVALYVANSSSWLDSRVLDSDQFVATAVEAMEEKETRDASAEIIVDRLVDEFPLLTLLESPLTRLFSDLLAREAVEELLVVSATNVHRRMIQGNDSAFIIDLAPYREMLIAPLHSLSPEIAALVPAEWFQNVEILDEGVLPDLSTYDKRTDTVAIVAAIASVILIAIVFLSTRRWGSALAAIGTALVVSGGISLLLVPGARSTVDFLIEDEPSSILITNVFNAFTRTLITRSLVMVGIGVLLLIVGGLGLLAQFERSLDKSASTPASTARSTTPGNL